MVLTKSRRTLRYSTHLLIVCFVVVKKVVAKEHRIGYRLSQVKVLMSAYFIFLYFFFKERMKKTKQMVYFPVCFIALFATSTTRRAATS